MVTLRGLVGPVLRWYILNANVIITARSQQILFPIPFHLFSEINKLTLIPYNIFSFEDVQKMRKEQGLDDSKEPTTNQINVWVNRKYIVRLSDGRFEKVKFKS